MARRMEVQLLDDIDGSPAAETVSLGIDGQVYEIDLAAKRAAKLRADLQKYVAVARRVGRTGATPGRRRGLRPASVDRAQNQAVREWAKRKKIKLADRGRIPRDVIERYEAEVGR